MHRESMCGEIAHLAHHAACDPERWDEVARAVCSLLGATAVGFFEHDYAAGQGDLPHAAGIDSRWRALYASRFASLNVWLDASRAAAPCDAFTGIELVP